VGHVSRLTVIEKGLIPLGKRKIAKEGAKFKLYLPKRMNDLWEELYERGYEVEVYLAIAGPPEGGEKPPENAG